MANQQQEIEKRLAQIPVSSRNTYLRAMKGRSLKTAIKAQCLECVGWIREEVEKCTDLGCPLYPYRPFQKIPYKTRKTKGKGNVEALLRFRRTAVHSEQKVETGG